MNEFNEYVREVFSVAGDIVIRSMMGGYLVYLNGKLVGDIGDNELFLKMSSRSTSCRAPSARLLIPTPRSMSSFGFSA